VPDEVLVYVLGHLGEPPAPINPDILDRMLSTSRGKEIQKWSPPQPTIDELKEQHGDRSMTDEELLRRYLVPLPDVEATHAAGPAPREYHFESDAAPTSLVLDLLQASRASFVQVDIGSTTVTLRR
jgi:oxaloacetate decarboxylase alpha subunit